MASQGLSTDSTATADTIEAVLEVMTEHPVLGIGRRIGPHRTKASDQSGDPIGCLESLVAVTLQMNGRFDEMPAAVLPRIHVLCCRFD